MSDEFSYDPAPLSDMINSAEASIPLMKAIAESGHDTDGNIYEALYPFEDELQQIKEKNAEIEKAQLDNRIRWRKYEQEVWAKHDRETKLGPSPTIGGVFGAFNDQVKKAKMQGLTPPPEEVEAYFKWKKEGEALERAKAAQKNNPSDPTWNKWIADTEERRKYEQRKYLPLETFFADHAHFAEAEKQWNDQLTKFKKEEAKRKAEERRMEEARWGRGLSYGYEKFKVGLSSSVLSYMKTVSDTTEYIKEKPFLDSSLSLGAYGAVKMLAGSDTWKEIENTLETNVNKRNDAAPQDLTAFEKVLGFAADAGSSTLSLTPFMAVGGKKGAFVGSMMLTLGDTYERNLALGMGKDEAMFAAFAESAALAGVEIALGDVPYLNKVFGGMSDDIAKEVIENGTKRAMGKISTKMLTELPKRIGKDVVKNSAEEAFEEFVQYCIETTGESIAESIGQDTNFVDNIRKNFSWEEAGESALGGAIGGGFLSGLTAPLHNASQIKQEDAFATALNEGRVEKIVGNDGKTVAYRIHKNADTVPASSRVSAQEGLPVAPIVAGGTSTVPTYSRPQQTAGNTNVAAPVADTAVTTAPAATSAFDIFAYGENANEITARVDSMSDDELFATAQRLGIPGIQPGITDNMVLQNEVKRRLLAELSAKSNQVSAQDVAPVNTPVSGENSISRESLIPSQEPLTAPPASQPVSVNTPPPETPSVPSVPSAPQVTLPSQNNLAYTGEAQAQTTAQETASAPEMNSFGVAAADLNALSGESADIDTDMSENKQAAKTIQREFDKYSKNKKAERTTISAYDPNSIKDAKLRRAFKAAQSVFRALGVGDVVLVETDKNNAFAGLTIPGNKSLGNRVALNITDMKNNPRLLFKTAMHELVHNLIANNKDAYNTFLNKVITPIRGEEWVENQLRRYAIERATGAKRSQLEAGAMLNTEERAMAEEEFICDTVAELMSAEIFWKTLAAEDMTLAKKLVKALKGVLQKISKAFGKLPDNYASFLLADLENNIELAQKFISEASGKSRAEFAQAVAGNMKTSASKAQVQTTAQVAAQDTTQVASAENAQTTGDLSESSQNRKPETTVPEKGTPKENLEVAPVSDQSVPSVQTPSDTAAPVEQVPEQGKKKKITIADLNKQAKAKREAKQGKAETQPAEQTSEPQKPIDKITSAKAGSRERIMAFTELPDGEHTVNGKRFTKKGNLFTLNGKTLNAKDIEKATRTTSEKMRKTVEEAVSDAEVGYTTESQTGKTDSSGGIKFSMIGKKGVARMKNAETLLDNLRIAKEMTAQGKDAKTIKLATGWEKGKDGKWRMEIPDLKWKIEATLPDGTKYQRTPFEMVHTSGKLSEYINAAELFQAYPELKNIKLNFRELAWAQDGYFDENRNEIVVNSTKLSPIAESIDYIGDQKGKDARKQELVETVENILIHEVQHAIQKIEGFAKGGSLEADKKLSPEAAHKARANALRKHLADAGFEVSRDEAMLLTDENANDTELEKLWNKLVDKGMTEEKYDKIFQKIPLFIGYHNLAGEVEARNVVTRSRMSMAERRQSLLDETADVAEEDRIYLMEQAGVSGLAVDKDGNQLFNVQGKGQMTITDIINDKSISEETEILTDSGSNVWGTITEDMAKKGKDFGLDPLPIKLLKGNHGFGIVHIYKHLSDFPNQDLARLMELVFGDINKIYARDEAGNIKLEIFPPKARYYGILELRKQDGYYSVVSFFTRKSQHEKPKGKLIWVRSSQSATSQATNNQPKNEISGKMLQENQAELTAQTSDNINPLQAEVNPASSKNPENSSGGVKFSMPGDLGDNRINWDNKNGMGATPDNANVDYRGFQIELSAAEFRNLTPSGRTTGDLTKMKKAISDGEGIASPTLYADWNEQKKRWEVTDHEGRSRRDAISELYGADTLMPVHIMPYKLRARDITQEMLDAPFVGQGLAGYDWATEYPFNNRRRSVQSEKIKFSISDVWTGSAADYDKPSLLYVGTGEGAQMQGYGLYGSSSRGVGEGYAERDVAAKNYGIWHNGRDLYMADELSKSEDWILAAYDKVSDYDSRKATIAEVEEYLKDRLEWYNKYLKDVDPDSESVAEKIKDIEAAIASLDEYEIKSHSDPTGKRHLYRQTFFANKEDHDLLDWDGYVTKDQGRKILSAANNEQIFGTNRVKRNASLWTKERNLRNELNSGELNGEYVYKALSDILGSPKAASEFLYRAGIDGITYIGDSSGVRNYVAFSDKDIRVDEHIKFSMPGDLAADVPGENLVVVHNTTANKLRNALKLGGMPAPSLAVIDTEKSDFSDFGEITLIAEKELIDPKNKKNKVYNADIYSPRSPQIVYEYSKKDYDRAFEKLKPYETREADDRDSIDKLVYYHKNGMTDRDFAEDLKTLPAVRVWFNRTNTADQDFDTWWETVALPELNFSQDGKIFNGYTASGRRKWLPATLENVVKLMTKKIRNGEGFNYGIGNIRSMVAKQFKSIADIKKNRESIVSEEAFKTVKKDIQNEFRELEEEMRQASVGGRYGWSFDTGSDCLLAMAEGGRENMQYLKDRFGDNEEILGKMAGFLKKLENLPTEYFEAKPQRALNLDEFRSAVIPEDTPADVKKSLENAGVEVFTYKDKADRKTVLQKATANKGIKFSKAGDLSPDTPQSEVEANREREMNEMLDPELTAEERKAKREIVGKTVNYIADTLSMIWEKSKHTVGYRFFKIDKAKSKYYTDRNRKDDLGLVVQHFREPIRIAQEFPDSPFASIVGYIMDDMPADKVKLVREFTNNGEYNKLMKKLYKNKNKETQKAVNDYLLKADRDQTGAGKVKANKEQTVFTAVTPDGKVIGTFSNLDSAWDALFRAEHDELLQSGKLNELGAKAVLETRRTLYKTWVLNNAQLMQALRQNGMIDPETGEAFLRREDVPEEYQKDIPPEGLDLMQELKKMGDLCGSYFPRARTGEYHLIATKNGKPTQRIGFLTEMQRGIKAKELQREGYTVRFEQVGGNRDMIHNVDPLALSDILNQAFGRSNEIMKENIALEEVDKELVLTSKVPLTDRMRLVIKDLGGKFRDGAWHFDGSSNLKKAKLQEVIQNELAQDIQSSTVLKRVLIEQLVEMFRENGASSSKISRRKEKGDDVVRGYEDDLQKAVLLHVGRISGSIAHSRFARKSIMAWNGMDFDRNQFIREHMPEDLERGTEEYHKALLNATSEYYKEVHRRALDSSKQPVLVAYADKYITDMLRNPSGWETMLGIFKGVAAFRFLGGISNAIGNIMGALINVPAVISKETGKSPEVSLLRQMIDGVKYSNYALYSKFGRSAAPVNKNDQRIFDIIRANGWDGANMMKEIQGANRNALGKTWNAITEVGLFFFGMMEQINRAASIKNAATALAEKQGVKLEDLNGSELFKIIKQAKRISDSGNGEYSKANKPPLLRGGDVQETVSAFMLFQTFTMNQFNMVIDMLRNPKTAWRGYLYMTAMTMLLGGARSDFALSLLVSLIGSMVQGDDDEEDGDDYFYDTIIRGNLGDTVGNFVEYGIPGLLGANMTGTLRSPAAGWWQDGLQDADGTIRLGDIAIFSIVDDMVDAIEYTFKGQHSKAWEAILPKSFAGIPIRSGLQALRESKYGVTDRAGRKRKDIHDEYITPDEWDTAVRLLGFNPVSISEKTDRVWNEKKIKQKYSAERNELMDRYRSLVADPDTSTKEITDLANDIEAYNAKVRRSKRNIPLIEDTTLENALSDSNNKFFVDELDDKAKQNRAKKVAESNEKYEIIDGRIRKPSKYRLDKLEAERDALYEEYRKALASGGDLTPIVEKMNAFNMKLIESGMEDAPKVTNAKLKKILEEFDSPEEKAKKKAEKDKRIQKRKEAEKKKRFVIRNGRIVQK